ncbi:transposase [Rhizobium bangladeshense]|uniref:transposase n=1 Tax=Rhizobium bangladeshense TaxID=1138189 RepID=UPI001C838AFF|nr:transposase [Rhizobium bangladeshense]MBX4899266.1 transposase [Rhizobium bangladeshense]MBX5297443.1 transposase [Rhizobium sp. NLR15a]MBY3617483.1 transposase [Rhizobium bangladeshense]
MVEEEIQTPPVETAKAVAERASPKPRPKTKNATPGPARVDPVKPAKSKSRGLNDQEKAERISRIDALVGGGKTLKDAVKEAGISDQTYYLWKKALAALPEAAAPVDDEFAEFIQLEEENRRLRKLLAEKLRAENADLRRRLGMK